ncbi:hypothetical protein EDB85DRAFT_2149369 [Lactarius pseudohatsudake]|nr:hypothetical protein EDB85DRAFT_2149369 [Lactarius pseudohatsudake]
MGISAPVPVSAPPTPTPAPATQFAADPTVRVLIFVSSHGKTSRQPREDTSRDPYCEKSVGDQLQSMITAERNKAAQAAQWTCWALNAAISSQVLVGAMVFGAAFGGQYILVAMFILGSASTFVASYLARTCGSDERRASLLWVSALNHFLRDIGAFQLIHGHEVSREWVEKTDGFRLGLENMLGN